MFVCIDRKFYISQDLVVQASVYRAEFGFVT